MHNIAWKFDGPDRVDIVSQELKAEINEEKKKSMETIKYDESVVVGKPHHFPSSSSSSSPAGHSIGNLGTIATVSAAFFHLPLSQGLNRPKLRVTSEFDSDSLLFLNKVSCKLFDNLAKLKLSFQNNSQREVSQPQLSLTSKHLSVLYDHEEKNTFIKSTVDIGPRLKLRALHNVKAQQGEVAMEANLAEPGYSLELASPVPIGYPRATLKFPLGEISLQEKDEEEEEKNRVLSVNGILKRQVMNGVCTALYTDEELRLRYAYKDDALSFIPTISLPSNAASFAFKRRFSPSDKLSYWYNFDSNMWSAVYKRTYGKDYKFKAGYDSDVRLGWASLWVGDEAGKVKRTPMKMKVQFMLQVPQDDVKTSVLMFRVKKRWDF